MIHIITATTFDDLKKEAFKRAQNKHAYNIEGYMWRICPEAKRHPAELARDIDALILSGVNVVIGTMTDAVINRVGYLISHYKLDHTTVTLDVIDYDGAIRHCFYDLNGFVIGNWPIGFFLFSEDIITKNT